MGHLKVSNLSIAYRTASQNQEVLRGLSFEIPKGESLGLMGPSGSGKSTLGLALACLLPPEAIQSQGEIWLDDFNATQASEAELKRWRGNSVALIFQEPRSVLNPLKNISEQLEEVLQLHEPNKSFVHRQERLWRLFQQVELPFETYGQRFPHELSGGQCQRALIAMALACEPRLLVCDEPTSALDSVTQFQILSLIKELQSKLGFSLLMISHDSEVVRYMCSKVLQLNGGQVSEISLNTKDEPSLSAANPRSASSPHSLVVLSVRKISKAVPSSKEPLLKEVSFDVRQGEIFGVVGSTGSGKTTLARCVAQLLPINEGEILFPSKAVDLPKHLQIVFQNSDVSLNPALTVREILKEPYLLHRPELSESEQHQELQKYFQELMLELDLLDRLPRELSGGQRQRVSLIRSLAVDPRILICDEILSAQDRDSQEKVLELLLNLRRTKKLTILMVTHDLRTLQRCADRVAVIDEGRLVEIGFTSQLLQAPKSLAAQSLVKSAFF